MNKKEYVTPRMKFVNMETIHMLAGSVEHQFDTYGIHSHARSQNSWDDDEDEIEDSMWK